MNVKRIGFLAAATLFAAQAAFASSDALIDALERKGLLTSREAAELKEQTYKDERDVFPGTKIVIGSWLDELKIYGDARVRYEEFTDQKLIRTDNLGTPVKAAPWYGEIDDRTRFRYRLRLELD